MKLFLDLFFILGIVSSSEVSGTLKFIAIFIRHGARTPIMSIPALERYITWPIEYGELTAMGQRQLYLLGRGFREQYINEQGFLSQKYNSSELSIESTGYRRTIVSGDSLLKGLYPDNLDKLNPKQLSEKSIWLPPFSLSIPEYIKTELKDSAVPFDVPIIPILSYNRSYDKLMEFASCPKYESFWDLYYNTNKFKELLKNHSQSLKWVGGMFGIDFEDMKGDYSFYALDYLLTSEFHGKLPILSENPDKLKDLKYLFTRILIQILTMDGWMQAIAMKQFSETIPKLFRDAVNGRSKKAALFMTHDMTMMQYLMGLGVGIQSEIFDDVPFAANLVIELREEAGEHQVSIFYNGDLLVKKKLEEFEQDMKGIRKLKRSWEEECRL